MTGSTHQALLIARQAAAEAGRWLSRRGPLAAAVGAAALALIVFGLELGPEASTVNDAGLRAPAREAQSEPGVGGEASLPVEGTPTPTTVLPPPTRDGRDLAVGSSVPEPSASRQPRGALGGESTSTSSSLALTSSPTLTTVILNGATTASTLVAAPSVVSTTAVGPFGSASEGATTSSILPRTSETTVQDEPTTSPSPTSTTVGTGSTDSRPVPTSGPPETGGPTTEPDEPPDCLFHVPGAPVVPGACPDPSTTAEPTTTTVSVVENTSTTETTQPSTSTPGVTQ